MHQGKTPRYEFDQCYLLCEEDLNKKGINLADNFKEKLLEEKLMGNGASDYLQGREETERIWRWD